VRRSKIALISGAAVGAVLLVVATVLLAKGIHGFRLSVAELGGEKRKLAKYYKRNPFPSDVNVRLEQSNVELLEKKFDELMGQLQDGNVRSAKVSGPQFSQRLSVLKAGLTDRAKKQGVDYPQDFAYGFSHYSGTGLLPKPAQAQRLSTQLLMVARLSMMLLDAEVAGFLGVKRELFDKPSGGGGGAATPPAAGGMLPGLPGMAGGTAKASGTKLARPNWKAEKLFTTERFELTFRSTEASLLQLLNALSASPMCCVVGQVTIAKRIPSLEAPDPAAAMTAGLPGGAPEVGLTGLLGADTAVAPSEEEADQAKPLAAVPVCGVEVEEPMTVTVVLDVYNFVGEKSGGNDE
jgi:hypothetical protein